MGEYIYDILKSRIVFSESSDIGCLCTFPFNDGEVMTSDRLKELALFGAAVKLLFYEEDGGDKIGDKDVWGEKWVAIPQSLPSWVVDGIDRILGM